MASLDVAAPGRSGRSWSSAASSRRGELPGDTASLAPALYAASRSRTDNTVPTPTKAPSTSAAMARTASRAAGVRSVTSIAGMPPATSARAMPTAFEASSMITTGTTGARPRVDSTSCCLASLLIRYGSGNSENACAEVGRGGGLSEHGEKLATHAGVVHGEVDVVGDAAVPLVGVDEHFNRAGDGIEANHVARANARDGAAGLRFGRYVDRRRHTSGCTGHAAIGEQRHAVSTILQQAQGRCQLVQLGHAARARTLEA